MTDYGFMDLALDALFAKLREERARIAELEARVAEATALIKAAVELMTTEQVGQWEGVRAWLEGEE